MTKHTIRIDRAGIPQPLHQPCHEDHKIEWCNDSADTVDSFKLPSCVSPQTDPSPIAPGKCTQEYTVRKGMNGRFKYSYVVESALHQVSVPQSGTIDPS